MPLASIMVAISEYQAVPHFFKTTFIIPCATKWQSWQFICPTFCDSKLLQDKASTLL